MAIAKDVMEALKSVILLTDRVTTIGQSVTVLAREARAMNERLIRLETTVELMTRAAFAAGGATPPRLGGPGKTEG